MSRREPDWLGCRFGGYNLVMAFDRPNDAAEFLTRGLQFWADIRAAKRDAAIRDPGWYPYESLSALPSITDLIRPYFDEITNCIIASPVIDLGCADGDIAMLFASLGADVDAIDFARNNFNSMSGVEQLSRTLGLRVHIYDLDLDFAQLPRERYGLAIFLGTLYHLKNPYGALETLAFKAAWCILSTRIAQTTRKGRTRIESEPLVYLADGREIANDATNYWIFSFPALLRILQRTRWAIAGFRRVGCQYNSNPVDNDADERVFLLLKSRVFFPRLHVRPLDGWYYVEDDSFCWTARRFSLEVILPLEKPAAGFVFSATLPDDASNARAITIDCRIGGELLKSSTYNLPGAIEICVKLPPFAAHEPILILNFATDYAFSAPGDARELGVCVHLLPRSEVELNRIPFRLF
jgi:tRNA (mo5U34)-methyltransferase